MSRSPSDGSAKTGSEELARLIRERREHLGMSRQDLADATEVPYSTIAQIETAYRGVSPSRLGLIARVLGLDPKELYDVLTSEEPPAAPNRVRRARPRARVRGDDTWMANPTYAAQSTPAQVEAAPLALASGPPSSDVVDDVVALLSELPPGDRLDALARVQSRLLSGLVHDEVQRATKRPRRS